MTFMMNWHFVFMAAQLLASPPREVLDVSLESPVIITAPGAE